VGIQQTIFMKNIRKLELFADKNIWKLEFINQILIILLSAMIIVLGLKSGNLTAASIALGVFVWQYYQELEAKK
jgi:hypothetical protein